MTEASLIFPDQLFETHPAIKRDRQIFLVEDFLFFRVQSIHKQKLILMRASMRAYADHLKKNGFKTTYLEATRLKKRGCAFANIADLGITEIHLCRLVDDWLMRDLEIASARFGWKVNLLESPQFLNSELEVRKFFEGKTKFSQSSFYINQRKKMNILMEGEFPVSGKYSLDIENRKKLPRTLFVPKPYQAPNNKYVSEAISYVREHFPDAVGESEPFHYAVTFVDAKKTLEDFLDKRFENFGPYEDAISTRHDVVFHSVLSPLLNIGLLTPLFVLESALRFAKKGRIPLSSVEGFVRQIIGWREYVRACYIILGRTQRTANRFKHNRKIPKGMWDASTGIEPVDATIKKLLGTGYCHHIERLMILGNFLLLTETDPGEVYSWFMTFFVDAYDWVMVPNVYGMSQFSDAGLMTTKPYVSGSNYILKMSDYKKGEWCEIWDGLFWRFLNKNRVLFSSNPRTGMLLTLFEKNKNTLSHKIRIAELWLSSR